MVDRYKVVVGNVTATAHAAAHPDGQYVSWHEYEALRVEVEAHKRSRQIDANEARSLEMELRAKVERLRAALESIVDGDLVYVGDEVVITCGSHNAARKLIADARAALRASDPTDASPASTTDA